MTLRIEEYTDAEEVYRRTKQENPSIPPVDVKEWIRKNGSNKKQISYFFTEDQKLFISPSLLMSFYYYLKSLSK